MKPRRFQKGEGKMAKRNQLEVGQQWAYSNKRNHNISRTYDFQMATIKSVQPYEKSYSGNRPTDSGLGVLVEITTMYQGEEIKREKVIQLSNLFMMWSEFVPAMEAEKIRQKAEKEAREVREAEQRKFKSEVYEPAFFEFQNAIKATTGEHVSSYSRISELPVEVLQAITNAMKVGA